jgi:hypothetical protein
VIPSGESAWKIPHRTYTPAAMVYPPINLQTAGILAGLLLVILHGIALLRPEGFRSWLIRFPRAHAIGLVLLTIDAIWAFLLVANMDLGEFSALRKGILIVIVAGYFLTWKFVDEFLAVRALGILMLLAAEPLLEAAFLKDEPARWLLPLLAYVWAVLGLFYVGMPYVLRDQIGWVTRTAARWKWAAIFGAAYGALVLLCAIAWWG